MNTFVVINWVFLAGLGYVTAHTVVERLLFHIACRVAGHFELDQFCTSLRELRSLDFANSSRRSSNRGWTSWLAALLSRDRLGWLGPLVSQANGSRSELKRLVLEFEAEPNRFSNFLATMVNVGGYLGLMGTVLAFVQMADSSTQNFAKLMPLAFETTLAGLLISIPASLSFGLLSPRAELIQDQIDLVLDAVDDSRQSDGSATGSVRASGSEELTSVVSLLTRLATTQELAAKHQEKLVKQLEDCIAGGYLNSPADSVRDVVLEMFDTLGAENMPRRINGNNGPTLKGKSNGSIKTR